MANKSTTVTYNPPENQGHPQKVYWLGQEFEAGKSVDVENPTLVEKAKYNPFFKVGGAEATAISSEEEKADHEEQMDAAIEADHARDHTAEQAALANEQRKRGRPVVMKDRAYVRTRTDGLT